MGQGTASTINNADNCWSACRDRRVEDGVVETSTEELATVAGADHQVMEQLTAEDPATAQPSTEPSVASEAFNDSNMQEDNRVRLPEHA
jgi:hypothetical protein